MVVIYQECFELISINYSLLLCYYKIQFDKDYAESEATSKLKDHEAVKMIRLKEALKKVIYFKYFDMILFFGDFK